jgi:hypothetical protein
MSSANLIFKDIQSSIVEAEDNFHSKMLGLSPELKKIIIKFTHCCAIEVLGGSTSQDIQSLFLTKKSHRTDYGYFHKNE